MTSDVVEIEIIWNYYKNIMPRKYKWPQLTKRNRKPDISLNIKEIKTVIKNHFTMKIPVLEDFTRVLNIQIIPILYKLFQRNKKGRHSKSFYKLA